MSTQVDHRYFLRIKPFGVLIMLVFLLVFNVVAVVSYQYGVEVIHFNVLFYMYFYFWITFFLIAVQVGKIINSQKELADQPNKKSK